MGDRNSKPPHRCPLIPPSVGNVNDGAPRAQGTGDENQPLVSVRNPGHPPEEGGIQAHFFVPRIRTTSDKREAIEEVLNLDELFVVLVVLRVFLVQARRQNYRSLSISS